MMKHWFNEIVVAIWACASFYIMHITSAESAVPLFFPLIAGAVILWFMTCQKPVLASVSPVVASGAFLLNLSIFASYLFNSQRYDWVFVLGNIASSLLLFFSLYLITTRLDLDVRKILVISSILINALLPVILKSSPVVWGRVEPPENPNYVGMMALFGFIGALAVRSPLLAIPLAVISFYSMMVLQSRDSLAAAVVALIASIGFWLWRNRSKQFSGIGLLSLLSASACLIVLALAGLEVLNSLGKQFFDGLFMMDDKYRGINSGGSGRDDLWIAAIGLWQAQPIFGVGFKGHTALMPDNLPAHNAYLAMLADTGLAGLGSYLLMLLPGIAFIFKPRQQASDYPLLVIIILTYLLYGLFEVRAFSFGNTYSVIFLLVVFHCSKKRLAVTPGIYRLFSHLKTIRNVRNDRAP